MASSLKKSRRLRPEQVWDHCARKLVIYLIAGEEVCSAKKSPYCKVWCGRHSVKSSVQKKTSHPQWNELFYFEPSEIDMVRIEVFDASSVFSDTLIGEVSLGTVVPMSKDRVIDGWHDVVSKKGIVGRVHVSMVFSTSMETKEMEPAYGNDFNYKAVLPKMKAGDLIAFNAPGVIAAGVQLTTNSLFSHVGMIVELPNKYTEELELYLLEVGRNLDGFLDVYHEEPREGITLFRMVERFHHFHGSKMWWVPRSQPLSSESQAKMHEYLCIVHLKEDPFDYTLGGNVIQFLQSSFGIGKNKFSVCDLYGPYILATALLEAGAKFKEDPKLMTPNNLVELPIFEKPICIRRRAAKGRASVRHAVASKYPTKKVVRRRMEPDFDLEQFSQSDISPLSTESLRSEDSDLRKGRPNSLRKTQSVGMESRSPRGDSGRTLHHSTNGKGFFELTDPADDCCEPTAPSESSVIPCDPDQARLLEMLTSTFDPPKQDSSLPGSGSIVVESASIGNTFKGALNGKIGTPSQARNACSKPPIDDDATIRASPSTKRKTTAY